MKNNDVRKDHHSEAPQPYSSTEAGNPLLWLYRRKDKSGESIIGAAAFAAGERLRSDLTLSGMLPNITMNWSNAGGSGGARSGVTLNPTEATIASRQRVDLAMRAVGPEFSGLLMDLCGSARGWRRSRWSGPGRSAPARLLRGWRSQRSQGITASMTWDAAAAPCRSGNGPNRTHGPA